ncbi:MAG: LysM peptidoglycan-binding domain-containing protein [Bacteroidetes bacterium]|nr:LysM peptidoglycan-binding domain-containing protein [Bacteroidota bacterium]
MNYFVSISESLDSLNKSKINLSDKSEYDIADYSSLNLVTELTRRILLRQLKAYKFLGLTKEQFEEIIRTQKGEKRKIRHIINAHETIFSISKKYGIEAEELLQINNLKVTDLNPGIELLIEVKAENIYQRFDIPVFTEHTGEELLGRDLNNSFSPGASGDFEVLSPRETIKQGVANITLTKRGDYPLLNSFGISFGEDGNFPEDLADNLILTEVSNALNSDPRISAIKSIKVDRKGNEVLIDAEVETIV